MGNIVGLGRFFFWCWGRGIGDFIEDFGLGSEV